MNKVALFIIGIILLSGCFEQGSQSEDLLLAFLKPSESQASQPKQSEESKPVTPTVGDPAPIAASTPTQASTPTTSDVKPWHSSCCPTPSVDMPVMPSTLKIFTFEYSGDLTSPTLTCRTWFVGNEPGRITRTAEFSPAGTTSVVTLGLPEGKFWCDVTGYDPKGRSWKADGTGLIWSIYQPGQIDAQWRYRANNTLRVDGFPFEQRGCYQGVGTILNEVTVAKDNSFVVANNSPYWQSSVCQ